MRTAILPITLALLVGLALGPGTPLVESAQPGTKPTRPHLVIVAAEDEYKTETTLPEFAKKQLEKDFRVSFVFADAKDRNRLPGLEVLNEADAVLISVRRRVLPKKQMDIVHKFVASGKPVVGIRTASHAFALLPGQKLAEGLADWPGFDQEVLGGHYTGHHGVANKTTVAIAPGAEKDPILVGVKSGFATASTLYRSRPLAEGARPLLIGQAQGIPQTEPVAWTWKRKDGGRTFYTSLGHPEDFAQESFVALLRNGIRWATGLPLGAVPRRTIPDYSNSPRNGSVLSPKRGTSIPMQCNRAM